MKWRIILIITTILLIHPITIDAACMSRDIVSERVRILNIASNVDFSSFYDESGTNINFNIRVANLHKDMYIIEKTKNLIINYGANKANPSELIISGYKPGDRLQFDIYAKNTVCINDVMVHTRYVTLPYYNPNYSDKLCSGIEDYYLCKKWAKVTVSYDEFKKKTTEYKLSIEKPIVENPDNDKPKLADIIINIIDDYHRPVLGTIIVLGVFLIIKESRKNDFGF